MNSTDIEVVNQIVSWLELQQPTYLVTVVETWGSSPRPAGSLLTVNGDGRQVGSVSGGCIEEHLIERIAAGEIAGRKPEIVLYGVTREEGERFGLPCGGEIKLVVEKLDDLSEWQQIQASLAARQLLCRESQLADGSHRISSSIPDHSCELTSDQLSRVYGPRWQLIIVGAVDLSLAVAKVAMGLDYQVVICDPRPDFSANWNLPGTELSTEMPDDLIRSRGIDDHCAIVTLTHDPRYDDMALMEALETDAFYVGSLGSDRTHKARLERLVELDVPANAIARLRGPIGLPIGSHTPNEIAIAIAAELIAVRNHAELGTRNFKPVMASNSRSKIQNVSG